MATDIQVELKFNRDITIPGGETESAFLAKYLSLLEDSGSDQLSSVDHTAEIDSVDRSIIRINPSQALAANTNYQIQLTDERTSRRSIGLVNKTINFKTASGSGAKIEIGTVSPRVISTLGGQFSVEVSNASNPNFDLSGNALAIVSSQQLAGTTVEYTLEAGVNLAGPATLNVTDDRGFSAQKIGALLITEPLRVDGISPSKGSINGGTVVEIKGAGFHQRSETLAIYFDDIPVASHKFDVVDPETIILTTPKGKLGFVDVKIDFGSGKEAVLVDGFEFLQASQSTIRGDGRIYDITLDPTLTYMFAAAGQNVLLYDMNSARLTSGEGNQLDAEDLLQLIDLNNDGIDDRLLASIAMPQGKLAVSVDGYFERFNDRVFITLMAHDEDGNVIPGTSELQIYSFDSADVSNTTLIKSLALPGNMVGRLEVENNRALVALGDAGIGLVDTYLHTKMYLSQQLQLPNGHSALDIEPISSASGTTSLYAVASGVFNLNDNQLIEEDIENSGAVYIVESTTTGGLNVLGSVAVPASRLEVKGNYIFASSGENGVIVIDASSPTKPVVLNRFRNLGHVYDIELSGNTIYAALGTTGVKTIDVTDVFNPVVTAGMSANKDVQFEAIVATEYSAIAAGIDTSYESEDGEIKHVIQLFSDVILKLHSVDPESRVLDKDAIGDIKLSLHFNKSIALWADNYNRFELLNESGQTVPFDLTIENNDAIFKVHPNS
ncbi:MAG: IPT/TIG domain-containing protein, partial [Kangiellaceae bacterium]|nr:IPT/TIG domain-containing protein [Kangiellaceae bacterium]